MKVVWTAEAKLSFKAEADFVLEKWNSKEVLKFIDLVANVVALLEKGLIVGLKYQDSNIITSSVSKQTKIFYRFNANKSELYIMLFWNNKRNPKTLAQKLK